VRFVLDDMRELRQFFAELSATEDMEVQVVDRLASIGAAVGNDAVTVADACASGNGWNIFEYVGDFGACILRDVLDGVHMHFRNNENVDGCLRIQVLEGKDLVVFVNLGGGNEACGNFTKNTIFHNVKPFFVSLFWRERRRYVGRSRFLPGN